jgi:O-antigen/teichoic acid export membrane protein
MLPKTDYEALILVKLSIFISLIFCLILLIIVIVFESDISYLLGIHEIKNWLYAVPFSVFLTGVFMTLNVYNNRLKNYKIMSQSLVVKTASMVSIQLFLGFVMSSTGLIIGQFLSYLFGNTSLAKPLKKKKGILNSISINELKSSAKKYIKFLKYSTFGVLLNSLSLNLNNILLSSVFSVSSLGFYSLSNRILGLPSAVFGSNISTLYFQTLSNLKYDKIESKKLFFSILKKLLLISSPIFLFLFFTVKPLFVFFYGEDWIISGQIAQILIPLFFMRFLSSTISPTIEIFEKQQYSVIINLILLLSIILIFVVTKIHNYELLSFFRLFSSILTLNYFFFIIIYYKVIIRGYQNT